MLGESVIVRAACGYVVVGEGQWKAMPGAQWGVIDALADPACLLDRRGQLRRANAAFLRLLGIPAAGSGAKALQGHAIVSALTQEARDRAALEDVIAQAAAAGRTEAVVALRDGPAGVADVRVQASDVDGEHLLVTLRPLGPVPPASAPPDRSRSPLADATAPFAGEPDHDPDRQSLELVFEHEPDGTLLWVNAPTARSLGQSAEALRGRNLAEFVAREDAAALRRYLERCRREGSARGRLRIRAGEREQRTWSYTASRAVASRAVASRAVAASVAGPVRVHALDVTDRVHLEGALRATEERYRRLLERARDGMWLFDSDDRCLYVNDAACAMLARSREAILDQHLSAFVPAEERANASTLLEEVRRAGSATQLTRVVRPDGSEEPIELNAVDLGDGTTEAIGRDMSEWLAAQERIRASEERYRTVVETPSRGIAVTDRAGRIGFHNEEFARLLGLERAPTPASIVELAPEPERARLTQALASMPQRRRAVVEIKREVAARGERCLEITLNWLAASSEILAEVLDVTDQRAMETRMRQAQRMDSVGGLAAGIAHDFNNLLTVIRANLSEARRESAGAVAPLLQSADAAAASAAELSRQLRAIGQASESAREAMLLRPLVEALLDLLRRTVGSRIRLVAEVPEDIGVLGAPTQLQHVLMNLALNGSEAMADGGTLRIKARRLDPAWAPFDMPTREHGYALLEVSDNGAGMDEETAARAFEPYFSTKGEAGTGLGLAMVYGIVREHEGSITLQTEPGRGTTIQIWIPAVPPLERGGAQEQDGKEGEQGTSSVPAGATTGATVSATVLVVDDRTELVEACRTVLGGAGHQVLVARHGREAIGVVRGAAKPPDLVLLDASMPGLSGRETLAALRALAPSLKVVVMSGFAAEALDGLEPDGDWAFLPKPFDRDTLLRVVTVALDRALDRALDGAGLDGSAEGASGEDDRSHGD